MDDTSIKVDIICPKCSSKAIFHSNLVGTYKLYPDEDGKVTCTHCGFNSNHKFSNKDYFYKVQVADRTLYAQTLDKLISLRDYFEQYDQNKEHLSPETDFPKTFYSNREELVKKINALLDKSVN